MRRVSALASAALVAAAIIPGWVCTADPYPEPIRPSDPVALNGTFLATSDGNWAQLNHQFYDQKTVISTWTIATTCSTSLECAGQMSSDQGWSAAIKLLAGNLWLVTHDVEDFVRCPDGTVFPGHQHFKFYPTDNDHLRGWDETLGPSGACGLNQWTFVEMPFTLVKTA